MDSEQFGDGLIITKATQNDSNDILDFLDSDFVKTEPLTNSLQATPEEMSELLKDLIKLSLAEPCFTYIVRSKDSKEIAGIRMACVLTRPSETHSEKAPSYSSWKANIIAKLLGQLEEKAWILYPEAKKLASWIILSVSEKFTRRGIARKLIEYRLDELQKVGCEAIITEATAYKSQQLFTKLDYQNAYEILHSDFKENNKQIFKCLDVTNRAVLCYKPL
jgi:GNAT superfamily N-acetyltransferase